jgi:arsenate reductase
MNPRPQIVVFACVHNAGRSQMAAGFFNQIADPRLAHARSAGTEPAERVHPQVVAAMREAGVDLSTAKPRRFEIEPGEHVDWLITMGCGEACPFVPGARVEDWPLEDPADQPLERVRGIRDEIRERVKRFATAHGFCPATRDVPGQAPSRNG